MNSDTNELILDLLGALDRSKENPENKATVSRTLLWQAKQRIELLSHRIAVLETEAAMKEGRHD